MPNYYDTIFGIDTMSREDFNKIALAGGVVGTTSYKVHHKNDCPAPRQGYGFCWLDFPEMGGHSDLILVAKSQEAAEYIRQGKIVIMIKDFNLSAIQADNLYSAAYGIKYGMEYEVLKYVIKTKDSHAEAWDVFPESKSSVRRWFNESTMPESGLSSARLMAVNNIVQNLKKY